ncbi:peptidylprolyl isomerase [Litoribacillus peritrichatus]|uniref:Peptidyl-prolyl cis-trans isomerase n=1 Tax=Litoribacillus peritrichatus TaxID=718191 RepID=A0ABP7MH43_9GAMM
MSISNQKVVTMDFKVSDTNGQVLDSSEGSEPLVYVHGANNIIPGLEKALEGKTVGDQVNVEIVAAEAYGEYHDQMVQEVPMEAFEGVDKVEPGMAFHAESPDGHPIQIIVTEVEGDKVTVDGNHPLAGKDLVFDVTVKDVRDATADELEHGHVHGPGCNH